MYPLVLLARGTAHLSQCDNYHLSQCDNYTQSCSPLNIQGTITQFLTITIAGKVPAFIACLQEHKFCVVEGDTGLCHWIVECYNIRVLTNCNGSTNHTLPPPAVESKWDLHSICEIKPLGSGFHSFQVSMHGDEKSSVCLKTCSVIAAWNILLILSSLQVTLLQIALFKCTIYLYFKLLHVISGICQLWTMAYLLILLHDTSVLIVSSKCNKQTSVWLIQTPNLFLNKAAKGFLLTLYIYRAQCHFHKWLDTFCQHKIFLFLFF